MVDEKGNFQQSLKMLAPALYFFQIPKMGILEFSNEVQYAPPPAKLDIIKVL